MDVFKIDDDDDDDDDDDHHDDCLRLDKKFTSCHLTRVYIFFIVLGMTFRQ